MILPPHRDTFHPPPSRLKMNHRQPDDMDAWILGNGVQPLAAAVYLIEEVKVPPNRVHILETIGKAGECTVSAGDPVNGYEYRSGAVPVFSGVWVEDLLCKVPSQTRPGKTALDDVLEFYEVGYSDRTLCTRFLAEKSGGISCINTKQVSLGFRDRRDLSRLSGKTEQSLERSHILDHFHESFFKSDYWLMIATTFGFQPYHSAAEFHRYVRRFMHNSHGLNDFHPLYEGRVNLHQAVTAPVAAFLESRGVDFQCHTTVTDIIMDPPDKCHRVSAIEWTKANEPKKGTITLAQNDIAIVSLGNIMSGAATGSNTTPPDLELIEIHKDLDENWRLWLELCTKHPKFGNAYNFCTRMLQSRLEVFTVTLKSPEFLNRFIALTGDQPGSLPYVTIKDSTWLMNMSVPRQPFFADQPPDVHVFWGYAMHPEKTGDFIKKPMINCSGEEIMMELLHHLKFPVETITCDAITIPCILPRMTSMLLPRVASDRPQIIPEAMTNLGLIGQFVEIPNEVVCSMDYGVKGAQMAVGQLMGLQEQEQEPVKASKPKKNSVFGLSRFL